MPDYTEQRMRLQNALNNELDQLHTVGEAICFCGDLVVSAISVMKETLNMSNEEVKDLLVKTIDGWEEK